MSINFKIITLPVYYSKHQDPSPTQFIIDADRAKEFKDHNLKLRWFQRGQRHYGEHGMEPYG